ncbi:MAG: protein kinase [Akkermansiaceae bacterium]|nr:protein kinase [Akkermansiaceae bacterium]
MNYLDQEEVPPIWQIGDVILDKYAIRAIFTSGGMGLVYRAYHKDWDMDMAVKSPRPEFIQTEEQASHFEREAETWVNLGLHPHIVSCFYVRRLGGIPRIFAEFVEGGTLSEWIRSGRLYQGSTDTRMERILDIAIQVAWGLHFSHQKGLVHQDVKPGNVLMTPDGTAKVSDFGLASARLAAHEGTATTRKVGQSILVEGAGFLTPEYASPEQFAGQPLSTASDAWSWAALVLEMLKGECDWTDGRAAPLVLQEFYQEKVQTDPLAQLLHECLVVPVKQRSSSLLAQAEALIRIHEDLTGKTYPRSYTADSQTSSDALNNKGASLLDLGKAEQGIECLEQAMNLNPRNLNAKFNLLVTKWRLAKTTDDYIIRELSSFRDEMNSDALDTLSDHICTESGVPTNARADRLQQLPVNQTRLKTIARHPSSLAAIRLVTTDEGDTQLITVSRTGSVLIQTPDGVKVASFPIPQPAETLPTTAGGRWMCDGLWISDCAITRDGQWVVFSQHKALTNPDRAKMQEGKLEIPIETRIYSFDMRTHALVQSRGAHKGRVSCFSLLNEHELLTGGSTDGRIRIWQLPDLSPVGELDLSSPEQANRLAGAWPFQLHHNTKLPLVTAYYAIEVPSSGYIVLCQDVPRLWKRPILHDSFHTRRMRSIGGMKDLLGMAASSVDWQMVGTLPKASREDSVGRLALSPAGDYIAGGRPLHVWAVDDGIKRVIGHGDGPPMNLAFSPGNQYLLDAVVKNVFYEDKKTSSLIRLWQVTSGRRLCTVMLKDIDSTLWEVQWFNDHVMLFGCDGSNQVFSLKILLPPPSSFLSLARPTSFAEVHHKRELVESNIAVAEQAFDCGQFTAALKLVRSLQLQEDLLTDSRLQKLERRICAQGVSTRLRFGVLERQFEASSFTGDFVVNILGAQPKGPATRHHYSKGSHSAHTTPDGRLTTLRQTVARSFDNVVLWDNVLDRAVSSMQLPGSCDSQACISDDGTWAVAMIRDCWLRKTTLARYACRKWPWRDWRKITTYFEGEDRYVAQIALCDDNSKFLVRKGGVEVWDVATGRLLRDIPTSRSYDTQSPISTFDCYPFAFLGGDDGAVSVIDCEIGMELFVVAGPHENVKSLVLSQDKLRLVVNGKWVIHLFWDYLFPSED